MSEREYVRLGLRILDEQLVDSEGRRVGRVEDLELEGGIGRPTRVVSILCGATAWKRRLPPSIAQLFPGDPAGLRRVPWEHVKEVENEILLSVADDEIDPASDGDPAELAVSDLLGRQILDQTGKAGDKIRDVIASRSAGSKASDPWEIAGVLVGRQGLLQRAGFSSTLAEEMQEGRFPENFLDWEKITRRDDEGRFVTRP